MDILIVEDDSFKYSKIEELVSTVLSDFSITRCDNVHDTIMYLNDCTPDKIILDMSLPSHAAKIGEGNPFPMPAGGIEIILELRSLSKTNIPIIVLTQYPDIEIEYEYYSIDNSEEEIKRLYGINKLSAALYDNDSDEWQAKTIQFLRQ